MESMIGQTLGQYQLVEQIGKGGMATVYKAFQPSLNRAVAIKILPPYFLHEAGFAERFTREAQAIAQLDHPNILPVYDFGKQGNISYIVMKYVPAGTLHDQLGSPMSPARALKLIEQIAGALDNAHQRGILHRDIKPSNILIDERGWVYLSDFGLAKMVEGSVQLTGSGVGVGTPAYMSPEQGQGLPVDARTDVYSLGVVLFEMLTGRVPYEAETPMAVVIKHITDPIPLPRQMNPHIPEAVERVLLKALAKEPADRFSSAGEMAAALRRAVEGLEPAIAAAPIPPDPEATVAHVGPIRPSPLPAPSPVPAVPPVYAPAQKGLPWLPIVFGLIILGVAGVCGLAGLMYMLGGTPTPMPAQSVSQSVTDTPFVTATVPLPTAATPTPPPPTLTPTPRLPTDTPLPLAPTDIPIVVCTPPPCASNEVYFCPGECPGGCGTECATLTPNAAGDTLPADEPTPTFTPTPTLTLTPTLTATQTPTSTSTPTATLTPAPPRWSDTGLRPTDRYAAIWSALGGGDSELGYPLLNPVGDRLCARQYFERGYMVWFDSPQDPDPVWAAVIPDPAANRANKSYRFSDTWPGSPEYWCADAEARAPLGPKRGFGMLWCKYPDLRADIGQARDEELGGPDYPRCEVQAFQGGAILHNPLDAKYWVFIDNGGWYRFDE